MKFWMPLMLALSLTACGSDDEKKKGGDDAPTEDEDGDADTDADGDADADADADTDSDADTDTDTDTDTSDTGTWTPTGPTTPVTGDVSGNTYDIDLSGGTFVQPPGVGTIIGDLLVDIHLFFAVESVSATEIDMVGALGDSETTQDVCIETLEIPPAAWTDPRFDIQSPSLVLSVSDIDLQIDDLALTGFFEADGESITNLSLAGSIDTRPLAPLVDASGTNPNAICEFVAIVGVSCLPCPNGSGDYCLGLEVRDITAEKVDNLTLVPRSANDIANDPACDYY